MLLKHAQSGVLGTTSIKWDVTKFIVNWQGQIVNCLSTLALDTTLNTLVKDAVSA